MYVLMYGLISWLSSRCFCIQNKSYFYKEEMIFSNEENAADHDTSATAPPVLKLGINLGSFWKQVIFCTPQSLIKLIVKFDIAILKNKTKK